MARQSLLAGTAVLTFASLLNRLLGFIYQIFLIRILQAEGIGLFSMVFPLYVMALVLGSAGIPAAVAKLVAEAQAQGNPGRIARIFRLALLLTAVSSLLVTAAAFALAPLMAQRILTNPQAYLPFVCLLPSIPIVSLCSVFRGLYQGWQDMSPTASSQIIEQVVRVFSGLALAFCLAPSGVAAASCGASLGVVAGETAGFLFLLFLFRRQLPLVSSGKDGLWKEFFPLISFALPVTFTRLSSTLFLSLEALLIPHRLVAGGHSISEATALYGQFAGVAETLLYTPSIVTVSLATALVPAVAEAAASRDPYLLRSRIYNALRLTLIVGLPSAATLYLLATPLCQQIFGYPEAGVPLRLLALGAPFLYLQQTTTSILQGLGYPFLPFRNLVLASSAKIALLFWLTALPPLGIKGAALAFAAGYFFMAVLNLFDLLRLSSFLPPSKEVLRPLAATLAASVCFLYLSREEESLILSLGKLAWLLFLFFLLFRVFSREDWSRLQAIAGRILRGSRLRR
ncbi:stage V sporulation protein B [Ammonifex thiophilus]|uniref:Stage V sporulation protein B n=1 Tax=Ammonifex thiophilus TaxID=444093 RepID=A0A3D8P297_9THEO|nr:stage V sporulation protein B [Ammonifex thiophilus]RDV82415.1 stage V sporulation protein B [Ammonifex thiophilus]